MKSTPWKLATIILTLALAMSFGLPLARNADAQKKPQPHLRAALTATRTAIRQLNKAAPATSDHRVKAIEHLQKAEAQILEAIEARSQPTLR